MRIPTETRKGDDEGDVINGMAFLRDFVAVSTPSALSFWKSPSMLDPSYAAVARFPWGAHDIIALTSGQFMATMGQGGLLLADLNGQLKITTVTAGGEFYYYRVANLGNAVVCALRSDGMLAATLAELSKRSKFTSFQDVDVVDVCGIPPAGLIPSFIAAGIDGTLVFFPGSSAQPDPPPFRYQVGGDVYRVLCTSRDVFILTSVGLYSIPGLIERYRQHEPIGTMRASMGLARIHAVDANLVGERWLLIVLANNKVLQIDIDGMLPSPLVREALEAEASQELAEDTSMKVNGRFKVQVMNADAEETCSVMHSQDRELIGSQRT
jgi:hypothetical protein